MESKPSLEDLVKRYEGVAGWIAAPAIAMAIANAVAEQLKEKK